MLFSSARCLDDVDIWNDPRNCGSTSRLRGCHQGPWETHTWGPDDDDDDGDDDDHDDDYVQFDYQKDIVDDTDYNINVTDNDGVDLIRTWESECFYA